ncbi:MAG: 1-(5-phosphoribosyl)-5-((5-phosphoribosylamino)methylideneamino)imidazole-4-carboxamide isomerase [Eggerthellaceae bacterium]|nr:1-(5-phosphoribosyl)-5-((5-phosphoribosylamino)methylideneamino)imidazole-4-carboxamide isomerase [Eggerthellaceae bacterium]
MEFFPAIDLLGGRVVRLKQGDYNQVTVYNDDPAAVAADFQAAGARWIHVVDLDAAKGDAGVNDDAIAAIVNQVNIGVEVGGGIRTMKRINDMCTLGVRRIVLGTRLARDTQFAKEAAATFGDCLVAGVDAKDGLVAVQGWTQTHGKADDLVASLADMGYRHLIYTDISRDGMQTGIDKGLYEHLAKTAGFPVGVSGGIASLRDIEEVVSLGPDVVEGVISGRALYEGAFSLVDALAMFDQKEASC